MTPNDYLKLSSRTATKEDFTHVTLGLITESAEFADIVKKNYAYDKPFDKVNAVEELGDLLWYVAMAMRLLDTDFETVFQINIEKLRARYPDGFDKDKAMFRDVATELEILERGVNE